ncbi:MAG: aspartate-semialdehyde dehydrogenase [Dehalococcoidia bacterium]|nr:aspartate-semialdehyde dehydrogenase [Dehalococcoidia bacterium]
MERFNIAVIGAATLVGQEFVKVLGERGFPVASLQLFTSKHSSDAKLFPKHQTIGIEEMTTETFYDIDIAFFAAGTEISYHLSPLAIEAETLVIDTSNAFRMDPKIPLVVPEVNPEDIKQHKGIIANPNCSTIQLVVALYPLHKINPIKRIIVNTYQSVSGSGAGALKELIAQTKQILEGHRVCPHIYSHQIAFNVLPETDVFLDNGYTKEEQKMADETRKIMHAKDILISATCVRVPVYFGHSESINVEFSSPITPEETRRVLVHSPSVKVLDDPSVSLYPLPWAASGSNHVFVGRIRSDTSHPNGLAMWIVADNLRKGTALNAVQIVEEGIKMGYITFRDRKLPHQHSLSRKGTGGLK